MTRLELLAPARNVDIGIAAIACGADAVYIGGPSFGARVDAGNSIEDIKKLCDVAAPFGVRIYVTVNTLARTAEELKRMAATVTAMKDSGIAAFIIQDTRLLNLLRSEGEWKEEFHASTQCAIRTAQRACELSAMGFSRLILERELSVDQISAIRKDIPSSVELEFFVHGALCVCYSGDCYLSEYLTGRSANRGECAQPCRSQYDLVDASGAVITRNKPLLSLKDLEMIDRLEDLANAGITSFKIEGRLKNEAYVKNVVSAYSAALDKFIEASGGKYARASLGRCSGGFVPDLDKTFNRGYTSLFIDGDRGDWNSGDAAKSMGEKIGRVSSVSAAADQMTLELKLRAGVKLSNGDGLSCVLPGGEVCGFRADRADGNKVVCKLVPALASLPGKMKSGKTQMDVWRNRDVAFERTIDSNLPRRLIQVTLSVFSNPDSLEVEAVREDGARYTSRCDTTSFAEAENKERMYAMMRTQLGKSSGCYQFEVSSLESSGPVRLLSSAFLNELRHTVAEGMRAIPVRTLAKRPAVVAESFAPGREHPRRRGELMRTKYCILFQLGLCRKRSGKKIEEPLSLVNNGRRIDLQFDCKACEMVLVNLKK